jgi:hypothetical protein
MTIIVQDRRGNTAATIADSTVDVTTPLTLIGRNYAGFGKALNEDLYHLMENFASDSAPSSPAEGMFWYAPTAGSMKFRSATAWVEVMTASSASGALLSRMSGADSISFATTGSVNVHTGAVGAKTIVTAVLLIPQSGASVTGTNVPSFALEITAASGDICDTIPMTKLNSDAKCFFYNISGTNRIVTGGDVIKLNKKKAVSGGDTLVVDAYLFGHVR